MRPRSDCEILKLFSIKAESLWVKLSFRIAHWLDHAIQECAFYEHFEKWGTMKIQVEIGETK